MICIDYLRINYLLITPGSYRVKTIFLFFFFSFLNILSLPIICLKKSELGACKNDDQPSQELIKNIWCFSDTRHSPGCQ